MSNYNQNNFYQQQNNRQKMQERMGQVNTGLSSHASRLKAMSLDPKNKIAILSNLARYGDQISHQDYQEIMGNIKGMKQQPQELNPKQGNSAFHMTKLTVTELKQFDNELRNQKF